jgi:isoquinoline 1-oxidoreductase beta subunit
MFNEQPLLAQRTFRRFSGRTIWKGRVDIPFGPEGAQALEAGPEVTAWVVIKPDDTVVIRIARSEMGQGTMTGLAQVVA